MTTIYFATNRKPNRAAKPADFGSGFSNTDLGDLRFGRANVDNGSLDEASIEVLPDNPRQGSKALFAELRQSMKADQVDSLLFIHGFNVSFRDAMDSAGKLSDTYSRVSGNDYQPNVFVFSWPSDGKLTNYFNDRHDAEVSGYAFARGMMKLSAFLKQSSPEENCQCQINLIAHSMGNYVLRHALQQARKIAGAEPLTRIFDNIVLAAADEDNDAFEHEHKLACLPELGQRITVYFNNGDLALRVSDHTKRNPDRLGHDGPRKPHEIPAKVVLVDASDVVTGVSEHCYHQDHDRVARDIVSVLQGERSEKIKSREYVPHANKFRLV